jgi:DNA mismatch repair protein MutL
LRLYEPMLIRQLPEAIINQIAAGEVIERPASVIKELVENALDAGATDIRIVTRGGGLNLISVSDNGAGMTEAELPLAIGRHCTSKLSDAIDDIRFLGFRGEALASIGSVAKLTITSRMADAGQGGQIVVAFGTAGYPQPAAANRGTVVDVEDLFQNLPARLKFMRSVQAENTAIEAMVRQIALSRPDAGFTLSTDRSGETRYSAGSGDDMLLRRVGQVMGEDFAQSAFEIDAEREGVRLYGYASPASLNRANSRMQFVHVNGRPVRDRQMLGAIAGAYADRLPRARYAMAALYIEIEPHLVDVNVHPAKAEVRFRDPGLVRGLIVGALREGLDSHGLSPNRAASRQMAEALRASSGPFATSRFAGAARPAQQTPFTSWQMPLAPRSAYSPADAQAVDRAPIEHVSEGDIEPLSPFVPSARSGAVDQTEGAADQHRLGAARTQLHRNYIIAQTADGMVIIDQHAAHERLVYERLKQAAASKTAPSQHLLLPEIVNLPRADALRVLAHSEILEQLGLSIEGFGEGAIAVTAMPAALSGADAGAILRDIADELDTSGQSQSLQARLDAIASRIACHGSVRSGREMRVEEMNALLRQMEATPGSDTCNHGRPTFIALSLAQIERLFERR